MEKNTAKVWIKRLLKWVLALVLLNLAYIVICIIHGTYTEFTPPERKPLVIKERSRGTVVDRAELSLLNWNIGYMGLGEETDFFYDEGRFFFSGGMRVRSPEQEVQKNADSVIAYLKNSKADFILLQEVDINSKRSYFVDYYARMVKALDYEYCGVFATNFEVYRVPIPVMEPWNVIGMVNSGVVTLSTFRADSAVRLQLPGSFAWPSRIFNLKRCMAVKRFKTTHPAGKELVVINTHNSAYDKGGALKSQELAYIKAYILAEYDKGNYVIVGGDWNQCPPNVSLFKFSPEGTKGSEGYEDQPVASDFLPDGWTWAYDALTPTHRALNTPYEKGQTFTALIDYYLVSPNVQVLQVETKDLQFRFSDHQPVHLRIKLLDFPEAGANPNDSLPNQ